MSDALQVTSSDGQVQVFSSAWAAGKELHIDKTTIKRYAENGMEYKGFRFAMVPRDSSGVDPLVFVFGEEAGELFKDARVRVTHETPKRVSLYDVIAIVCDTTNPWQVYTRLQNTHGQQFLSNCEEYRVDGAGRTGLVTNAQGLIELVNVLPGPKAAAFRSKGAKLLVRFLGGDVTLADEVHAINAMHQSGATQHTMSGVFREAINAQQQQPSHKFAMLSPTMEGKSLYDFADKKTLYLVTFVDNNGDLCTKIGKTDRASKRMTTHLREIPNSCVFCIHECVDNLPAEVELKRWARENGLMKPGTQEVLVGITPEDVEKKMLEVIQLFKSKSSSVHSFPLALTLPSACNPEMSFLSYALSKDLFNDHPNEFLKLAEMVLKK